MMFARKVGAIALALALATSPAFAASTLVKRGASAPSSDTVVDLSGGAGTAVVPGVVLIDPTTGLPYVASGGSGGGGGGTVTQGPQGASSSPWFVQTTSPLLAGTAIIGKVGIDQTTPGTTNGVVVNSMPAIPAGSNAIGTVGVTALPSLPAGANAIGTVGVTALPALPAGSNAIGSVGQSGSWNVGGFNLRAFSSFVRPANTTAYASGNLVANSTTAGSVTPLSFTVARAAAGTGFVRRLKLSKTSTGLTNAQFRVHLYRDSPTASNGDGGAWLTTASIYLGAFDVIMDKSFTDQANGIGLPVTGTEIMFDTAAGSQVIYGLVEARAAYTPASAETFTATLEAWPN